MDSGGFHPLDALVIIVYLAILTSIGVYFAKRQHTLDDFIKGGRELGWLTIGVSLMAALNSGIDFVQAPAMVYTVGLVFITAIVSWIPAYPWIARVTLPFYQKLNVYSAYEYLERRFNVAVRTLAAMIFILWRVGWMGAALYVPILAFKGATGITDPTTINTLVILLGVVVTTYTMLGGMKAVIWTDVTQFVVMLGGLATMLFIVVSHIPGGVGEIISIVREAPRSNLTAYIPEMADAAPLEKLRIYFTTEVTAIGIILAVLMSRLTAYTCDQVAIQRFQTAKSVREARNAFAVNAITDSIWMVFLGFVGLALYAFYSHSPMPEGTQNDQVIPYFLNHYFPVGLTGLVLAAITAASLSSVDAAINSTTSIVVVDFYNRLFLGRVRPADDLSMEEQKGQVQVSRITNLMLGVLMILISCYIPTMDKSELYQAANKILGSFFGPLFGIFILGMFTKRATSAGVLIGGVAGLCSSLFFSFFSEARWLQSVCGSLFGEGFVEFFKELSWAWPSPFGVAVVLIVGYSVSLILPAEKNGEPPLTYRRVMEISDED